MSNVQTPRISRRTLVAGGLALAAPAPARAAEYPDRPIRIIVGFAPGGAIDIMARLIAVKLAERFKQQAFVENRPGANANIAADTVSRAAPDGYTILMITSSHAISAALRQRVNFDHLRSFAPISEVAVVPNAVLVQPSLGVGTLQDFIRVLKASPGKYNYASTGVGGATQLCGEAFKLAAGVDMTHVPYQGAGPALTALMSGEVQAFFGSVSGAKAYVEGGQIKALAVPSRSRSSAMPEVLTTAEAGLPDFMFDTWYGMLAPARTPAPIVQKLADEFKEIMSLPDVKSRLDALGAEAAVDSPKEFTSFLAEEVVRLNAVAKKAGLTPS